jgi:hypothetical protein
MREAVPPKLHELNVLLPRTVLFENPSINKGGHTNQYRIAWLQDNGEVANRLYPRAFSAETGSAISLSPFIVMGNVDIRRNRSKKGNKEYYNLHVDYYNQTCSAHSNMLQRLAASAKVNIASRPAVWTSNNRSIKVIVRIHEQVSKKGSDSAADQIVDSTFKVRRFEMQGNDRVAHEVPLSSDMYQNYAGPVRITAFISTISIDRAGDRPYGKVIITAKDMVLLGRKDNVSGIAVKTIVGKDSPLPAKESSSMESILTIIKDLDEESLKSLALVLPDVLTTFTPEDRVMIRATISTPSTVTKLSRAMPNVGFKPTAQNPHM